jgi:hypothetical protein
MLAKQMTHRSRDQRIRNEDDDAVWNARSLHIRKIRGPRVVIMCSIHINAFRCITGASDEDTD